MSARIVEGENLHSLIHTCMYEGKSEHFSINIIFTFSFDNSFQLKFRYFLVPSIDDFVKYV